LEELKPLEEAQESLLNGSLQVSGESELIGLVTVQKAQLLRCGKIMKSLRTKLCDSETERAELVLQNSEKANQISSVENNLTASMLKIDTLQKKLSQSEEKWKHFETSCGNLQSRLDEHDKLFQLRAQEMGNLIRLVTEIDLAVQEMNKLVAFAQNVSRGQEPPMDAILELSEIDIDMQIEQSMRACRRRNSSRFVKSENTSSCVTPEDESRSKVSSSDFDSSEVDLDLDSEFDVDVEWILERLKQIRNLRKGMSELRGTVGDVYSDILSGGIQGCGVQ
jgi:chromosome segregation ATPase